MKKQIVVLLMLLFTKTIIAQEKNEINSEINFQESTVTYLKFSVDTVDELKSINWKDVKEIFSENDKNKTIELEFEIKIPKTKKINKANFSYKAKGLTKNIDNLIKKSKKGIKGIIKMANNLNKHIDEN